MKRVLILLTLILFFCSVANAFQGGGGESTKEKSVSKPAKAKPARTATSPSSARKQTRRSSPPAIRGTAELTIRSTPPNSLVMIDGKAVGVTDEEGLLNLPSFKPGKYTVSVSNTGYRPTNREITLLAGRKETLVLELAFASQAISSVRAPSQRESAFGFLTVKVNSPNSRIDISGIGQFKDSVNKVECQPGTYAVTVSSPSFVTSMKEVTVAAGQEAKLVVDLVAAARMSTGSSETVASSPARYAIPSGLIFDGILENEINTKNSKDYDRFRVTVQSPDQFRGATIEGFISGVDRAGKVKGRSSVTFNFEKITIRKGQTHAFTGYLLGINDHTGKNVQVDNEGTAKGNSKTKKTAKRGGLGAAIGAVVGGVVGGAAGAAAGAAIGGGAGAASAAIDHEDIKLKKGSTISLRSSSPVRQNTIP